MDRILPPTETPGAAGAGVHWYLDDVARFEAGLRDGLQRATTRLDHLSRAHFSSDFADATVEQQDAVLSELMGGDEEGRELFALLKRETLRAYYRSEIGQVGELEWVGHEFHASFPGGCPHPDPGAHPRPKRARSGDGP